jgi:hypothetical protein
MSGPVRADAPRLQMLVAATAVVALLALCVNAVPADAAQSTSRVTVTSGAFVYMDHTHTATVDVVPDAVAAPREVVHAELGFDARRTVDPGPEDREHRQDTSAATQQQRVTVEVNVRSPGDLRVLVEGTPVEGLDPRPVPGSAVPLATQLERGFVWEMGDVEPGVFRFEATMAPGATAAAPARFVPGVTVSRTTTAPGYAAHLRGTAVGPSSVLRTDELRLTQIAGDHAAPVVAAPALSPAPHDPAWRQRTNHGELSVDGNGRYDPLVSGAVTAANAFPGGALLPYRDGVTMTIASMGFNSTAGRKVDWTLIPQPAERAFGYSIATAAPLPQGGLPKPALSLYDGDAARVAIGATASPWNNIARTADPGDSGEIVMATQGTPADAVAYLTSTDIDGTEPNATNIGGIAAEDVFRQPVAVLETTTVELRAAGGDIDNRGSDTPRYGEARFFTPPEGYVADSASMISGGDVPVDFDVELVDGGVLVTPYVRPGEYVLEPTISDEGVLDWTTYAHLSMTSVRATAGGLVHGGLERVTSLTTSVPPGRTAVAVTAVRGASSRRVVLPPGLHRIEASTAAAR